MAFTLTPLTGWVAASTDPIWAVTGWSMGGFNMLNDYYANDAIQRPDGGFMAISQRYPGDVDRHVYNGDFWVVALDQDGIMEWQRSYGLIVGGNVYQTEDPMVIEPTRRSAQARGSGSDRCG